jgi:hypothetical protein
MDPIAVLKLSGLRSKGFDMFQANRTFWVDGAFAQIKVGSL